MLYSLKIKNFKSIKEQQSLDNLGSVNILTGENNSGKTITLEVLWILGEISRIWDSNFIAWINGNLQKSFRENLTDIRKINQTASLHDFIFDRDTSNPPEIELAFKISGTVLQDFFKSYVSDESHREKCKNEIKELDILRVNFKIDYEVEQIPITIESLYWGDLKLRNNNRERNILDISTYLRHPGHPKQFNQNGNSNDFKSLASVFQKCLNDLKVVYIPSRRTILPNVLSGQGGDDVKGSLLKREMYHLYHGNQNEQAKYLEILEIFKKVTGKEVYPKPRYERNSQTVDIVFKESGLKDFVDIDDCGYGYQQLISLLYNMKKENANIVLFDEPEISFHPQRQIEFFNLIKSIAEKENKQFFIATHSPYFVDFALANNIYKSSKNESTYVFQIRNKEFIDKLSEKKDRYFNNFRFRELFFMDRVIFVEGSDDYEYYLSTILENKINISNPNEKIYTIGGYDQHRVYILSELCKEFKINNVFIFDFDYYLYDHRLKDFIKALNQIKEIPKGKMSGLLKKCNNTVIDKDGIKKAINSLFPNYSMALWGSKSIQSLIKQEKENNIFIIPFTSVKMFKEAIKKGQDKVKNELIKILQEVSQHLQN